MGKPWIGEALDWGSLGLGKPWNWEALDWWKSWAGEALVPSLAVLDSLGLDSFATDCTCSPPNPSPQAVV